ncbi:MAG: hypothetical protein CMO46_09165 [Verrucomicrobiales bacterium]|nr:hypothetical protein [Verrucomicrobiales bacterium]|tara:strand:+ start:17304 stop:17675 length:372 start_codon:yes stop_codon:yes gene_type:complete
MISINEVTKIDEKRKQIRKEIYTRVYEQFSRKIRQSVELGHKQVFLTVPTIVVGYPTFDRSAAARYIARQLKLGGFEVKLVSDYDIYVSWVIPKKVKEKVDEPDETEFPDLMNLKKMADRYRA